MYFKSSKSSIFIYDKKCTKCKQELDLLEFWKDKSQKDGLNVRCKACDRKYIKEKSPKNATLIALKRKEKKIMENLIKMGQPPKSNIIENASRIWDHRVGKYIPINIKRKNK